MNKQNHNTEGYRRNIRNKDTNQLFTKTKIYILIFL